MFPGKAAERLDIIYRNIDTFSDFANSRIAWRTVYFFNPGTLGQLPYQRMFAAPAANNQDSHIIPSSYLNV